MLQYRLVVKTALKLLLVFVEYTEQNSQRVYEAVQVIDEQKGEPKFTDKQLPPPDLMAVKAIVG